MTDQSMIRALVRGTYDLQKLRIENGNRLVANFRAKLGLDPNEAPEEKPKILVELERRFKLITDGVVEVTRRRKYQYDGVISDYTELCLVYQYVDLMGREKKHFRQMAGIIERHPLWDAFFKGVKGCGPAMSGVCLSEIDIHKAKYASSLWKYAGLDVGGDGRGRSRRAEHLVEVEYEAADGTMKTRRSITFNPFLKTKLMGVLASSILRAGDSPLRDVYDGYKHRLEAGDVARHVEVEQAVTLEKVWSILSWEQRKQYYVEVFWESEEDPERDTLQLTEVRLSNYSSEAYERFLLKMKLHPEEVRSRGHRHNMALRFMIKRFLAELYVAWRTLESLEVHAPYSEAKLKMKPHGE